jgi:hypothetical protein
MLNLRRVKIQVFDSEKKKITLNLLNEKARKSEREIESTYAKEDPLERVSIFMPTV